MSAGGLFHPNDVNQENVFKHAIHDVNANHHILSRSNLSGQIEKVSAQDSFHASKRGNDNTIIRLKLYFGNSAQNEFLSRCRVPTLYCRQ